MSNELLPNVQQENLLTILCFGTEEAAHLIISVDAVSYFDNEVFRIIAAKAIDYIEKFKETPKQHLADILDVELSNKNKRKADIYKQIIGDAYELSKEGINEEYILAGLRHFLRRQKLKSGIITAAKLLQEEKIEEAESTILGTIKARDELFEPGITLNDSLAAIESKGEEVFKLGIEALDRIRAGPSRKTLFLLMAPTNRGKSWGLIHIGKHCLLQRLKVLHITLEMSQNKVLSRYLQSLFGMLRNEDSITGREVSYLVLNSDGEYYDTGWKTRTIKRKVLTTAVGKKRVEKKLKEQGMAKRLNLVVKQFPAMALSLEGLNAYMDLLERHTRFIPDVVVLDYPDLMAIDTSILRIDTGRIYKGLRGISVERNLALVAATQSNREAEGAKRVTLMHTSEDYSKAATADVVLTYTQSEQEKYLGLARLFAAKVRDERSGDVAVISQAYPIGQFCMDSVLLPPGSSYFDDLSK